MASLSETFQGLLSHLMKNATYSGMDLLLLVKPACLVEEENSIHPNVPRCSWASSKPERQNDSNCGWGRGTDGDVFIKPHN